MRSKLAILTLAAALLAPVAANAAPRGIQYAFLGRLSAVPANGAVSISVEGGNKAALRAMLGAPVAQTFGYGSNTEFLKWADGIPSVVQAGDLAAGDYVWVRVRAPRGSSLAEIESRQPFIVGDHGATLVRPANPLFLFRGTLTSVGTSTVTVHVTGGDRRALHLLLGATGDQTFTFGGNTIFLLWQGKVPTVIDASKLVIGDRIVVRIRADKGSSLANVEAQAANHIGDREPPQP